MGGSNGRVGKERPALALLAQRWPTPAVADTEGGRKGRSGSRSGELLLNGLAATWSTPRASDGEKGGPNMSFGAGGTPLPSQAVNWQTPSVVDATGRAYQRAKGRTYPTLDGEARSYPDRPMLEDGQTSLPKGQVLNPRFVEALMGWPIGWTDFALEATEWFHWQQRMRIAFSRIGWESECLEPVA